MKALCVKILSISMLLAGLTSVQLRAEEEGRVAVPARSDANDPNSEVYRASDIMNMPVKNDDGAEVGRIKDLVINGQSREVLYAVVAMNDAKVKDSLYVMPWNVFQPSYGQNNALQYTVLNLPQNVWLQAPYYSPAQWRQASYGQWGPQVNNYYRSHINSSNSVKGNSTSVRVNKPVINDNNSKESNPPKPNENGGRDKNGDKPAAKDDAKNPDAKPKSTSEPKAAEKPAPKDVESKPTKDAKVPAPKTPDPAAPKNPAPAPKTPAPK